jgi:hypothetical protein
VVLEMAQSEIACQGWSVGIEAGVASGKERGKDNIKDEDNNRCSNSAGERKSSYLAFKVDELECCLFGRFK